jgi:hypothetical protein
MKRILAPILLLTLLFPSIALGETMGDLVKTDGLYYKKFTDVPFTGKVTGKTQGSFRNGKRDGPFYYYHPKGGLHTQGTYKDGKKNGPWIAYYGNGQLYLKGTYKDGKKDGPWIGYDKYGNPGIYTTGTFKNGVKVK